MAGIYDADALQQLRDSAIPLAYSILIQALLCYYLLALSNKLLNPVLVTAFWPVQVRRCSPGPSRGCLMNPPENASQLLAAPQVLSDDCRGGALCTPVP